MLPEAIVGGLTLFSLGSLWLSDRVVGYVLSYEATLAAPKPAPKPAVVDPPLPAFGWLRCDLGCQLCGHWRPGTVAGSPSLSFKADDVGLVWSCNRGCGGCGGYYTTPFRSAPVPEKGCDSHAGVPEE